MYIHFIYNVISQINKPTNKIGMALTTIEIARELTVVAHDVWLKGWRQANGEQNASKKLLLVTKLSKSTSIKKPKKFLDGLNFNNQCFWSMQMSLNKMHQIQQKN
jgi:hypothetical protein